MKTINAYLFLCSFVCLILGCSPENKSVGKTNSKVAAEKSVSAEEPHEVLEESSEDTPIAVEPEESLTQSEKTDFAEDIKIAEEKAKDLIEKFDKNIDDKSIRNETKAEFKQMLPDYKEKMIQVGKAKLIERANEEAIGN